ncbi:hypothetical protein C8R44DRAFT_887825 [Mycena epipterygia]|nr:hypothetical protein C8R44DRAFT_887825 [Mycena epipterygia]
MPCLTHLLLLHRQLQRLPVIPEHCKKSLQVLAALDTKDWLLFAPTPGLVNDPGFVLVMLGACDDEDYWVRANEHVRKHRAGETNGYIIELPGDFD